MALSLEKLYNNPGHNIIFFFQLTLKFDLKKIKMTTIIKAKLNDKYQCTKLKQNITFLNGPF